MTCMTYMTQKPGRWSSRVVLSACAVLLTGGMLLAGPLTPPATISSTYKTLTEVEPRICINSTNTPGGPTSVYLITQPGSYYLSENLAGAVGKHGIEINSSGVTIDLNGFDLVGVPAMGAFAGVKTVGAGLVNISVFNGSVRGWGGGGVDLGASSASNSRVERVRASGNVGNGIFAGSDSQVVDCSSYANSGAGIRVRNSSRVFGCTAYNNTVGGIYSEIGGTISNCAVWLNSNGNGINANENSTVVNCTAYQNVSFGIAIGHSSTASGCSAYSNTAGFAAGSASRITGCSAFANAQTGIAVVSSSTGCTITDSTAQQNGTDGINVTSGCTVRGNTCVSNGNGAGNGAGIHATGDDNRIEGNNCTLADRGIDVDAPGNFIARNTCSGNTVNWDVVAGNAILVVSAATAAAVTGNAGGTPVGPADPNVNFTY
jgi:parallel beta-helix repeat protein